MREFIAIQLFLIPSFQLVEDMNWKDVQWMWLHENEMANTLVNLIKTVSLKTFPEKVVANISNRKSCYVIVEFKKVLLKGTGVYN